MRCGGRRSGGFWLFRRQDSLYNDGREARAADPCGARQREADSMRDIQIQVSPELLSYMKEKGKRNIVIQVAQAEHSEIEIAEIFVQLLNDKRADELLKKRYSCKTLPGEEPVRVLFPPYHLIYEDEITFAMKKIGPFRKLTWKGIRTGSIGGNRV